MDSKAASKRSASNANHTAVAARDLSNSASYSAWVESPEPIKSWACHARSSYSSATAFAETRPTVLPRSPRRRASIARVILGSTSPVSATTHSAICTEIASCLSAGQSPIAVTKSGATVASLDIALSPPDRQILKNTIEGEYMISRGELTSRQENSGQARRRLPVGAGNSLGLNFEREWSGSDYSLTLTSFQNAT